MKSALLALSERFSSQCDGDWENTYVFHIYSLGNPGWALDIDLDWSDQIDISQFNVRVDRSESDWIIIKILKNKGRLQFQGSCGVMNIEELISIYLDYEKKIDELDNGEEY